VTLVVLAVETVDVLLRWDFGGGSVVVVDVVGRQPVGGSGNSI
jgi:hypothetical protein